MVEIFRVGPCETLHGKTLFSVTSRLHMLAKIYIFVKDKHDRIIHLLIFLLLWSGYDYFLSSLSLMTFDMGTEEKSPFSKTKR